MITKLAVLFMRILNWETLGEGKDEGKMSNLSATEASTITGTVPDCVIAGGDHVGGMFDYSSVCNSKVSEQWKPGARERQQMSKNLPRSRSQKTLRIESRTLFMLFRKYNIRSRTHTKKTGWKYTNFVELQ